MLSKAALRIVSLFASLFVSSFIFANSILLYASFAPLLTLLIGILMDTPRSLEITRSGLKPSTWVGENLVISLHVKVEDGLGPITIIDEIPSIFALIEGSNFKVFWKGRGSKSFTFSYKVRCTKRGSFTIPPIRWE
ncbi:MAG: BatD family protein, partial [Candidatus Thorarchaeota archaeon]